MPQWQFHSKALTAWRRRWRLNRDPTQILDAILPVAQVDKHFPDDLLNLYGIFSQAAGTGGNTYLACMLSAQEKEVLLHRIHGSFIKAGGWSAVQAYHLFTPLQAYNPVVNNTALWLPWLQTPIRTGEPGNLSQAFGTTGDNAAQQVVNVNGAPHISIGPVTHGPFIAGVVGGSCVRQEVIWSAQDPPLRIAPFTSICVQLAAVSTLATDFLNVSMFYSEREDQGRVG